MQRPITPQRTARLQPTPQAAAMLCIALAAWPLTPALSQDLRSPPSMPGAGNGSSGTALNAPPLNGYAETLRPSVTRKPTSSVASTAVYAPIKKPVEEGQIPEIDMFVGESRVFPTPGVGRIAVGNGTILTAAALDNKEVILFANGVGTSSLFVWNEDGRYQRLKVNITPGDTTRVAREIASFLTTIPKAQASIIGDKVIVDGDDLSDSDLSKIDTLSQRYPQIVNFTNRIGLEQMVMLDVKVVEFPTSELRELGLKWTAMGGAAIGSIWNTGGTGNGGPFTINLLTGANNPSPIISSDPSNKAVPIPSDLNIRSFMNLGLNATLNALAQDGKTTILAQPQLSARNGSKASFLAGGEYPYTVSTINGPTVQFKPYGVKLDILPKVDRNGLIRATIDTEFSQIDSSVSAAAGPALLSRKTSTEFNVRAGQTIILSGLIQRETSNSIDKVPFLGDIPVLGALFRSTKFQNKETELVIFVTPTVVSSASPGMADRVQKTKDRLEERLGKLPYLSDPLQGSADPARLDLAPPQPLPESITPAVQAGAAIAPTAPQPPLDITLAPVPFDSPQGSALRVTLDGLVVRARPDAQSEPVAQLGKDSIVTMTDKVAPTKLGYLWRHVKVAQLEGWVAARWVEPSMLLPELKPYNKTGASAPDSTRTAASALTLNTATTAKEYAVLAKTLALRLTPDVNAPLLQTLYLGQLVRGLTLEPRGTWSAIDANGTRGWVPTQWLLPVQSRAALNTLSPMAKPVSNSETAPAPTSTPVTDNTPANP